MIWYENQSGNRKEGGKSHRVKLVEEGRATVTDDWWRVITQEVEEQYVCGRDHLYDADDENEKYDDVHVDQHYDDDH